MRPKPSGQHGSPNHGTIDCMTAADGSPAQPVRAPASVLGTAAGGPLAVIGLMLVAANQRTPLAAVPPVLEGISADTGLSAAGVGLLSTLPIVTMGLLAPLVAPATRRIGTDKGLIAGLLLIALGSLIRLAEPATATLMIGAVLAGAGITTLGTLLPAVLVRRFPGATGHMTGWTTFALAAGATAAASFTYPLAVALDDWRAALAFWALPAIVSAVAWLPSTRGRSATAEDDQDSPMPIRSPVAWAVVGFATAGTICFFSALAWVAPALNEAGATSEQAGYLLGAMTAANMVGALLGPSLVGRFGLRRLILAASMGVSVLGLLGLALLGASPTDGAPHWLVAAAATSALTGFGLGAAFGLALLMLADVAADAGASRGLSALTFLVAYLVAAPFPTLLGWLADRTGSFTAGWLVCAAVAALALPLPVRLGAHVDGTVSGQTVPG